MTDITRLYRLFLECRGGVSTDTRKIAPNALFFALRGERFNGNEYAHQALELGARYAVVDEPQLAEEDERFLLVPNTLVALQELARHHRESLGIPVISITGTNGKTTTKELVASVLSTTYNLLYTQGNLNNHIGVPMTLLQMTEEHQLALIEMGASKPGDIAELCTIAQPNYGLITNIGEAHLQGFGTIEGVRKTKGELYDWLREHEGKAFVSADDPMLMDLISGIPHVSYGTHPDAMIQGNTLASDSPILSLSWQIPTLGIGEQVVQTKLVGAYNLPNVLAAVSIGAFFDVSSERINASLASYTPTISRSQLISTSMGNMIIADAYNANPTSMRIAIENFLSIDTSLKKLLILGDMNELGEQTESAHLLIRHLVREAQTRETLDVYYCGAIWTRLNSEDSYTFADVTSLNNYLETYPPQNRYILVKGSNGVGLSKTISLLESIK